MKATDEDFTDRMGQLSDNTKCKWPMYSFDRAAYLFWNGFANGLKQRGLTEAQIKDELQSKGARWLLDFHGDKLEDLGAKLAMDYELFCKGE